MVSEAASGSTSWVCDPSLESYALEQPQVLIIGTNVMHHLSVHPLYVSRCVLKYIIARIQSLKAIFLFPDGQESSFNSPYVPRMSQGC